MKLFCNHKWKVLEKQTFPSKLTKGKVSGLDANDVEVFAKALEDRVSVLVCCDECGAIKRYDM